MCASACARVRHMCFGVHVMKVVGCMLWRLHRWFLIEIRHCYHISMFCRCFSSFFCFRPLWTKMHWIRIFTVFTCADCCLITTSFRLMPTVRACDVVLVKLLFNIRWCDIGFGVPLNETHINKGRLEGENKLMFAACKYVYLLSCGFHSLRNG